MTYTSFDEILNADTVDYEQRVAFTRSWLLKNYGVSNASVDWLNNISDVHDHDNYEKHFGQVEIGTAFMAYNTMLAKVGPTWHVVFNKKGSEENQVIHPKSELSSFHHPENQKLRLSFDNVLSKGVVNFGNSHLVNTSSYPSAATTGTGIVAPEVVTANSMLDDNINPEALYAERDRAAAGDNEQVSISVDDYSTMRTKSVGIDLSQYL